jgi:N-[(2S)-2-amino-2-carboxyethyl]-L-glutamate dehydrogenase
MKGALRRYAGKPQVKHPNAAPVPRRTLADVMAGRVTVPGDRPAVFSPFGLGVLDLAVGKYVYDEVTRSGQLHVIDDFFHELRRYG